MLSAKHCIIASLLIVGTVASWFQYAASPKQREPKPDTKTQVIPISAKQQTASYAVVRKVIDGDTIELSDGSRVRYIGIDTPETKHPKKAVQCFGEKAFKKNKDLVEGKKVRLEKDVSEKDRYERLLRYVYVADIFVNDYLVRQGYAYVATFPPDVKYQSMFLDPQREARENSRGLWSQCK